MKIITSLPPQVAEFFDRVLLSRPCPKFMDDSETLWKIYLYIINKLARRCNYNEKTMKKFEQFCYEFLELYGRTKTKETEFKEENGKSFQGPFDYFTDIGRNNKEVFSTIRHRAKSYSYFN